MSPGFRLRLGAFQLLALGVGVLALAACFVGAAFQAREFYQGYLFGWLFWLSLSLGCMTITMIHYLTGGRWGYPSRRIWEAAFSTLPLMLLLFVPVFIGIHRLYPWDQAAVVAADPVLQKRAPYMNHAWFIGRTLFNFALWFVLAWLLRRWSLKQDGTRDPAPSRRLRALSGPGLVILPTSVTFAYVDWVMSLERDWTSSIFGVVVLAGQVLAGFAFTVIVVRAFERQDDLAPVIGPLTYHQLGNLILAFVMFWSYAAMGQLIIIYSANLPHEISWYLHRIAGGWKAIVAVIAFFHFFLPFTLLLLRTLKRDARSLVVIAGSVLLVHMVLVFWYVAPSFHPFGFTVTWFDFTAPIGVGGVWLAAFLALLKRAPLLPANDPRMEGEMQYGTK